MRRAILIPFLLAFASASAWPDQKPDATLPWSRACAGRTFLSLSVIGGTHRGDLDGKLVLGTSEKVFFIPKLETGYGFRLGYGQASKTGMWQVAFARTVHDASYQGIGTTAYANAIEVSGKGYLLPRAPVLPYLDLGFGFPWIHVTGGAERGGVAYNSNYLGLFIRGGGGFLVPVGKKIFLSLGASYGFMFGMYAKGPGKGRDVTNLYVDRYGPKRDIFLKIPGARIEIGVSYFLR